MHEDKYDREDFKRQRGKQKKLHLARFFDRLPVKRLILECFGDI